MKNIIKKVIEKYGMSRISYGLITFGSDPETKIRLAEYFNTENDLKRFVDATGKLNGAALDKALVEAKKSFDGSTRPQVKKVLELFGKTREIRTP